MGQDCYGHGCHRYVCRVRPEQRNVLKAVSLKSVCGPTGTVKVAAESVEGIYSWSSPKPPQHAYSVQTNTAPPLPQSSMLHSRQSEKMFTQLPIWQQQHCRGGGSGGTCEHMSSATSSATPAFSSMDGTADSMFGVVYSTLELPMKSKTFHGNHSASSTCIKFPACSCILHAHPPCVHAGLHAITYMETLFHFSCVLRSSGPLRCHNPHHVAAPLALRHDRTETRTSPSHVVALG